MKPTDSSIAPAAAPSDQPSTPPDRPSTPLAAEAPVDATLAARVSGFTRFFEQLTPARLDELPLWYSAGARFKDPFHEVQGTGQIQRIFAHMYDRLDEPRFVILDTVTQGSQAFITWEFLFRFKASKATQAIRGASHLQFDTLGLVSLHRDYWDAAEELYEKLPGVGVLMRWLKRRAAS